MWLFVRVVEPISKPFKTFQKLGRHDARVGSIYFSPKFDNLLTIQNRLGRWLTWTVRAPSPVLRELGCFFRKGSAPNGKAQKSRVEVFPPGFKLRGSVESVPGVVASVPPSNAAARDLVIATTATLVQDAIDLSPVFLDGTDPHARFRRALSLASAT